MKLVGYGQVVTIALALAIAGLLCVEGAHGQEDQDVGDLRRQVSELESRLERLTHQADEGEPTDPAVRMRWYGEHVALVEKSPHKDKKWQFLGPTNISGRVTDVAIPAPRGLSYEMYVASASGGVWKTENEGLTWRPVFEHGASTSIGDVTLAPSNPNIVWIGTGEANIFRSSMAGAGVYKSTDAGETWKWMGLAGTHTIPRILIHPENPDIVYVAASGHEWTPNEERGVYKSLDGGESWEKILYIDDETGAIDLVMHPEDPETLYAATWQRTRKRWHDPRNEPHYDGSGIHKTTDGGASWNPINNGLPIPAHRGRIGIDLCLSQPDTLYAFVDSYEIDQEGPVSETDSYGRARSQRSINGAEVYRSDDAGGSWRKVSESNRYMRGLSATYGWVFGQIRVCPQNPERIFVMGLALNVSEDGGKSFRRLRGMHGDHHALWIDPDNPSYLVNGNDGGICVSYDAGKNWKCFLEELPLVQFFNVGYDMDEPFHIYGSIQDHGSRRAIVDLSRGRDRIPAQDWGRAPGGEGSSHVVDPTDPTTVYSAGFYGRISRTNVETWERKRIVPTAAKGEEPLRGQWIAPFIVSPHNPRILYHGMNFLYRSWDRGDEFEKISPDLSYNDPSRIGDISYQTIFTISESPLRFGVIYAGTDDGRAHVTLDGGETWREITEGVQPHRWISRMEASRFQEGTVYMSQNGKRHDDFTPYLWVSSDFGRHWRSLAKGIPSGPINVVREDPRDENILYVGTDLGVYVSTDRGRNWDVLGGNLPTTFVHDLFVHPRDDIMVIATHGRGMYAMDMAPFRVSAADDPDWAEKAFGDDSDS